MERNYRPRLNEIFARARERGEEAPDEVIKRVIDDCDTISPEKPFIHIKNYDQALEKLRETPYWIAYGGVRTASTFSLYLMELLIASLTNQYLRAYEGDFRSTSCFFDIVDSTNSLDAGLLKIHRYDDACNSRLSSGRAKALVTTRDFPSAAASWLRMRSNIHSPFYSKHTGRDDILKFVRSQIDLQKHKMELPGCLFIKAHEIEAEPIKVAKLASLHFGIELSKSALEKIAQSTSKDRLIKRQKRLAKNSTGHDPETFLHYAHIDTTGFNHEDTKDLVMKKFASELDEKGYLAVESSKLG